MSHTYSAQMMDTGSAPFVYNPDESVDLLAPPSTLEHSRSPSPSASIRAMYVRSRPTSMECSDSLPHGFSIDAALRALVEKNNNAKIADSKDPSQYIDDYGTGSLSPSILAPTSHPRFRTIRLVDAIIDRKPAKETSPSVGLPKHQRSRTWSVKRLGALMTLKTYSSQPFDGNKTDVKRRPSLGSRFGKLSRPPSNKGVENLVHYDGEAELRRTHSLGRFHLNASFIDGLEAEGLDEATADAVRSAARMNNDYAFEQLGSEEKGVRGRSDSKSLFNLRG